MTHVTYVETDPDDLSSNPSTSPPFRVVASGQMSRRGVLRGGVAAAVFGFFSVAGVSPVGDVLGATDRALATPGGGRGGPGGLLGFMPVPATTADTVTIAEGYSTEVLIPWGTPIRTGGPAWKKDGSNTAAEQAQQIGMHHDGMHFFPAGPGPEGNRHGWLVLNHEYAEPEFLYPDGPSPMTPEKVDKALAAHGVSVVEVSLIDGRWQLVDSPRNRRITGDTPVTFSGPVGPDHPALQATDPTARGTLNNCASGHTPWGTYVACEENWNGYFGTDDPSWTPTEEQRRYGVTRTGFGYRWHVASSRFDVAVNPLELNRFGWCVEIDPADPTSTPVKRTALGRLKHEGATFTESNGRIVVYTGDDQNGDYVYKYVSAEPWRRSVAQGRSPLDDGTLYVARYDDDGSGVWLPLVHGSGPLTIANGWTDQADVMLRTRQAADALGATPMDRPEWVAVHPRTADVYLTLTNGSGNPGAVNTDRDTNPYGHIIRWTEDRRDNTATRFRWDIFLLAGDPAHDPEVDLDADSIFGSPDGLWIDDDGRLWIQTDVSNSAQNRADRGYDNIKNNAMLVADPATGEIRRFLVGPRGCEVTGVVTTPDRRTMFINIQHPGEDTPGISPIPPTAADPQTVSTWPDHDPDGRPRAATVVIRRVDGGVIGT